MPGLVGRGKLASLTIAQLSKYCQVWRGGGGGRGGEFPYESKMWPMFVLNQAFV